MPTLALYRGTQSIRYVELGHTDLTIGRALESDIVLEDSSRKVSRHHADLRYERGQYRVIGQPNTNGVWMGSQQLESYVLRDGDEIAIGPYRLVFREAEIDTAITESGPYPVQDVPTRPVVPQPPVNAASPTTKSHIPKDAVPKKPGRLPVPALVLGAVALGIVAIFVIARLTSQPPPPPPTPVEQLLAQAENAIGRSDSVAAREAIASVRAIDPENARAKELEAKLAPPPPPPPVPPPPVEIALKSAEAALDASELDAAAAAIAEAKALDPTDSRITDLEKRLEDKKPKPPDIPLVRPGIVFPPGVTPITPRPNELSAAVIARAKKLQDQLNAALDKLRRGDVRGASDDAQAIQRDEPTYQPLDALNGQITQARETQEAERKKAALQKHLDDGRAFEGQDTVDGFVKAKAEYEAAQELPEAREPLRTLLVKMKDLGDKRFTAGRQNMASGLRPAALAAYEDAVRLLPADDPNRRVAQGQIQQLRPK